MEAEPQGERAATLGWRLCTLGGAWGLRETRRGGGGAERRPRVGGTEQGPAWERPRGTRKGAGQDAKDGGRGDGARDRGLGAPGRRPDWRPGSRGGGRPGAETKKNAVEARKRLRGRPHLWKTFHRKLWSGSAAPAEGPAPGPGRYG